MDFTLSRTNYYADFYLTPAMVLGSLALGALYATPSLAIVVAAVAGYLAWTLSEYVIHRYVFHRMFRREHWMHHLRPRSDIGVPTLYSVVAQLLLYGACIGSFGMAIGSGLFAGYGIGYMTYIFVHHAIHRWRIGRDHFLRPAFERHAIHHRGKEVNFNVLWPIWDRLCGTLDQPRG
jgi:sterol desaturase/sphingolipid hydroxylase (fatty acid hydroxylase superfamily)